MTNFYDDNNHNNTKDLSKLLDKELEIEFPKISIFYEIHFFNEEYVFMIKPTGNKDQDQSIFTFIQNKLTNLGKKFSISFLSDQLKKKTIAIASAKGGVGKSTVTFLTARHLANLGYKVGIFDADIHGPSLPNLISQENISLETTENSKILPLDWNGISCMSVGFLAQYDQALVWRSLMVTKMLKYLIANVNWGALDYLLIDMPPGTGDTYLTLHQNSHIDYGIVITTPHSLSLIDAQKSIQLFDKLGVPLLGTITNMSYYVNEIGNKEYIFGTKTLEEYAKNTNLLGELPIHSKFNEDLSNESLVFEEYQDIVSKILSQIEKLEKK